MQEIICPDCKKAFKVDETSYADILRQVRDTAFEQQVQERLELAEKDKQSAVELERARVAGAFEMQVAKKDNEITDLKAKLDASEVAKMLAVTEALGKAEKDQDRLASELKQAQQERTAAAELAKATLVSETAKLAGTKDREIQELKAQIAAAAAASKIAVSEALKDVEKERDSLLNELKEVRQEKASGLALAKAALAADIEKLTGQKNAEIQALQIRLDGSGTSHKLATIEAVNKVERERDALQADLEQLRLAKELCERSLKEKFEI